MHTHRVEVLHVADLSPRNKEMMQPCLIHLHAISLAALGRRMLQTVMQLFAASRTTSYYVATPDTQSQVTPAHTKHPG